MTDCHRADVRDLLPEWVNGTLDDAAASDVAEHVATCAACADEAELIRAMRGILVYEPAIDVDRVARAVAARTAAADSPRATRRAPWLVIAGGLALAASVLFTGLLLRDADAPSAARDLAAPVADAGNSQPAGAAVAPDDSSRAAPIAPAVLPEPNRGVPERVSRLADAGLPVGGGLGDLEEDQLAALLRRLESMDAVPPISPAPAVVTDFDIQ